jgi:hypothetical protein
VGRTKRGGGEGKYTRMLERKHEANTREVFEYKNDLKPSEEQLGKRGQSNSNPESRGNEKVLRRRI